MLLIVVSRIHVSAEELSNRSETSGESGRRKIEIDGTQASEKEPSREKERGNGKEKEKKRRRGARGERTRVVT